MDPLLLLIAYEIKVRKWTWQLPGIPKGCFYQQTPILAFNWDPLILIKQKRFNKTNSLIRAEKLVFQYSVTSRV